MDGGRLSLFVQLAALPCGRAIYISVVPLLPFLVVLGPWHPCRLTAAMHLLLFGGSQGCSKLASRVSANLKRLFGM